MASEKDPLLSAENGEGYAPPETAPSEKKRFEIDRLKESTLDEQHISHVGIPIRRVLFNSSSHISVLFQMYGSVWPKVLPYCLFNILLTYAVVVLGMSYDIDLTVRDNGHSFMGILVAFLTVTRAKIAYARFMEARNYLQITYKATREIVQNMCILTMHDQSATAKKWRQDVAYQTIMLLRVTMAATEFESQQESAMDMVAADPRKSLAMGFSNNQNIVRRERKWATAKRDLSDENFRAPILLAYALRAEILSQRKGDRLRVRRADTKTPMHFNEERYLLNFVEQFVSAFHGLKKLITTPFPFPLVQMARTFLFIYTFTLPFALVSQIQHPLGCMLIIFFITYGFLGLEHVAMELDDPFGDDPNDFDDLGMAKSASEDVYLTIYKSDGPQSAETLRTKVAERLEAKGALDAIEDDLEDEYDDAIAAIVHDV